MDIKGFEQNLKTRSYSPRTIRAYVREVGHFQRYVKSSKLRITSVTAKVILEYLGGNEKVAELGRSSVRRKLAALSSYFDYAALLSNGRIRNPVQLVRRPRKGPPNPKPVDQSVLDTLVNAVDNERDKAIIMLFLSTGLRLSELVSLNRNSIQVERLEQPAGCIRILGIGTVIGKGGKEREFLVDAAALKCLGAYLRSRGSDENEALFLSSRKQRLSARTIEHMIQRWSLHIGLGETIHPHQLRHSMATRLHRASIDLTTIQQLLGHSSIAVTQQYVKPDLGRLRTEYFAAMSLDTL
jgi:site-specific recombinase XerD